MLDLSDKIGRVTWLLMRHFSSLIFEKFSNRLDVDFLACLSKLGSTGEPGCSEASKMGRLNFLLSALLLRNTDCLESAIFSLISALLGRDELLADFLSLSK